MSITSLLKNLMDNVELPVTNGMSKWYESGQSYTADAVDRVFEVIRKDALDNSRTSGKGRIRPSLIGDDCHRKHILSFLDIEKLEPSDAGRDVMTAGTWGHYRWQLAGLSAGWMKDIEVQVSHEPWRVAGAVDGILSDGSGFELKTVNSMKFGKILKSDLPLWPHLMQTHAYMEALGIDTFSIVYENRDTAAWKEFRVKQMDEVKFALDMLMNRLLKSIENEELPPVLPPCAQQSGTAWRWCDWKESCSKVTAWKEES